MGALLSPAVLLPVLGVGALVSVLWAVFRLRHGQSATASTKVVGNLGGALGDLNNSPILHLIAASLAQMGHDTGHKLVNALILKLLPGLGAILTLPVDKILDGIDNKIIAGGSPTTPSTGPSVSIPTDHPDFPVIKGVLDALAARRENKKAA